MNFTKIALVTLLLGFTLSRAGGYSNVTVNPAVKAKVVSLLNKTTQGQNGELSAVSS